MNRWQKKELKHKYGITFVCLPILMIGGMLLSATAAQSTHILDLPICMFGGMMAGASGLAFVIIVNMIENPRTYDCVKGGIIYNEEVHDRIVKQREKWRKDNLQ